MKNKMPISLFCRSNDSSGYGRLTPGMANVSFSSYGGLSPGREDLAGAFSQEMLAWYEDQDQNKQPHPSTLV